MIYITGDVHGQVGDLVGRCKYYNIKENDTLIILGDVGANFYLTARDRGFKGKANKLGITMFCVHGNHEARPETIETYKEKEWNGGIVYYEEEYPNLLFAKDGEVYDIEGKSVFVCGGAYSVDKYYRAFRSALNGYFDVPNDVIYKLDALVQNKTLNKEDKKVVDKFLEKIPSRLMMWWKDEQPSAKTRKHCEEVLEQRDWQVDIVLSHTSPERYEPKEMFLSGLNQDNVDKKTEKWFNKIEKKLNYKKWYAGHYHTNKTVNDKFQFLYGDVQEFFQEKEIKKDVREQKNRENLDR